MNLEFPRILAQSMRIKRLVSIFKILKNMIEFPEKANLSK